MKTFLVSILFAFLMGCASVGVNSPEEGVAQCYAQSAAVAKTASDMKLRGVLTANDEARYKKVAQDVLVACDSARVALASGDINGSTSWLQVATTLLLVLEQQLK